MFKGTKHSNNVTYLLTRSLSRSMRCDAIDNQLAKKLCWRLFGILLSDHSETAIIYRIKCIRSSFVTWVRFSSENRNGPVLFHPFESLYCFRRKRRETHLLCIYLCIRVLASLCDRYPVSNSKMRIWKSNMNLRQSIGQKKNTWVVVNVLVNRMKWIWLAFHSLHAFRWK